MKYSCLICITSCNRLNEVKKYIFPYIDFCNKNQDFDFLLAIDGKYQDYIDFCKQFKIPLLYSDEREGVGISKNRVMKMFPDYDYYFFIEDDVELLNGNVFFNHIKAQKITGFPHYIITHPRYIQKREEIGGVIHTFSLYGSAHFNFFFGDALRKVGGWHSVFAKYRRYGHTEHTYRFFHNGFQPYPFVVMESEFNNVAFFYPPSVSVSNEIKSETQLIEEEQILIDEKLSFFDFKTISAYHFNGFPMDNNSLVEDFLSKNKKHYPLTIGRERMRSLAEYYFERCLREKTCLKKMRYLILSIVYNPFNIPLKHYIKTKLF